MGKVDSENTPQNNATPVEVRKQRNASSRSSSSSLYGGSNYFSRTDTIKGLSGNLLDDDGSPTASSEKDLVWDY